MALDINITPNILSASTRTIGDKVFGNMLLGIPGGSDGLARAVEYLEKVGDVITEEVTADVE